ncbi:MAG: hypothetical protein KF775_06720 [Cyclobacteriaceae bacterium]|nr:hypothetical protein [Cyclobacteriaceae bacterium]
MSNIVKSEGQLNVLLVGNNPIDLSRTQQGLTEIQNHKVTTETAFDVLSINERLNRFSPNFILLDDNLGLVGLHTIVQTLQTHRKTRHVPITVLKNSNYEETAHWGVLNYVLKQATTGEGLYKAFLNSLKCRRTQQNLRQAYQKRSRQVRNRSLFTD